MSNGVKGLFSTALEAMDSVTAELIEWKLSEKHQRFGQHLESKYVDIVLPPHYYGSKDPYEVYFFVVDLIEEEFDV